MDEKVNRKEKLKEKKKNRKKRIRQEIYNNIETNEKISQENTIENKIEIENNKEIENKNNKENENNEILPERAPTPPLLESLLKNPNEYEEYNNYKKRKIEKKQHHGLRCKKCFLLIAKDEDFKYYSGHLWVEPKILEMRGFSNLLVKNDIVYCKNMHNIGRLEYTTYSTDRIEIYRIRIPKTTFEENYLNKYIIIIYIVLNLKIQKLLKKDQLELKDLVLMFIN